MKWLSNFFKFLIHISYLLPFLFIQSIILVWGFSLTSAIYFILSLIMIIALFSISLMWSNRNTAFMALHDGFYRFKGCRFLRLSVDNYLDKQDMYYFYNELDIDRPYYERVSNIKIMLTSNLRSRENGKHSTLFSPVSYYNPLGMGTSYIFLRDAPSNIKGIGKFKLLHELAHCRFNIDINNYYLLFGALPYWLSIPFVLAQVQFNMLTFCFFAFYLYLISGMQKRSDMRLYNEVGADSWALHLLKRSELEDLKVLLTNISLSDSLLTEEQNKQRNALLMENISRRLNGVQPLTPIPDIFSGWFRQILIYISLFFLFLNPRYVTAGEALGISLLIIFFVGFLFFIINKGYILVRDEVDTFILFSRKTEKEIVEDVIFQIDGSNKPNTKRQSPRMRVREYYNYEEPFLFKLFDFFSRFPFSGFRGFRITRWVNQPFEITQLEIEGFLFTASEEEIDFVRTAFHGALDIERRPRKILQIAERFAWFGLHAGSIFSRSFSRPATPYMLLENIDAKINILTSAELPDLYRLTQEIYQDLSLEGHYFIQDRIIESYNSTEDEDAQKRYAGILAMIILASKLYKIY